MAKESPSNQGTVTCYQLSDGQRPSDGVVRAVSAVTGLAPAVPTGSDGGSLQVMDPLGSVVDTDALDRLFDTADASGRISFPYLGHLVTVDSTGRVTVAPTGATTAQADRVPVPIPPYRFERANQ